MLSADDALPRAPKRILVAGVSGVGKTTLAQRIAETAAVPHIEIDALFHGEDWTPRPTFLDEVRAFADEDRWTTEWQYSEARPLLAARADLLVWLDLPFLRVTLPRVVSRTVRRRVLRERLWNGNVEPPFHTFFTDREHIVRWAVSTRNAYRERVPALAAESPGLAIVRLRSQREAERWVTGTLAEAVARTHPSVDPDVGGPCKTERRDS